jgi:hypothetical protein
MLFSLLPCCTNVNFLLDGIPPVLALDVVFSMLDIFPALLLERAF